MRRYVPSLSESVRKADKAGDPQRAREILVRVAEREHLPSYLLPGALAVDLVHILRCVIEIQ